jgi:hypothetical protein
LGEELVESEFDVFMLPPWKIRHPPKYLLYDVACKSDKDKKETLRYIKRSVFLSAWGRYLGIFSCKIPCNFQKIFF